MKRILLSPTLLLAALTLTLTGCTSSQVSGIFTGASLGSMFGSSIGALTFGHRGYHAGNAIGTFAGAAVGAALTAPAQNNNNASYESYEPYESYDGNEAYSNSDVTYGSYGSSQNRSQRLSNTALNVSNVRFIDANNNRALDANEEAIIEMDIRNTGYDVAYNVAPRISCSDSRVLISPTAIVESIRPERGVRYKAAVKAPKRLKSNCFVFTVEFGNKKSERVVAKRFKIMAGQN